MYSGTVQIDDSASTVGDVGELKERMTSSMASMMLLASSVVGLYLLPQTHFQSTLFTIVLSVAIEGGLARVLSAKHNLLARLIILLGPTASFAVALTNLPHLIVPFFAVLTVIGNAAISPELGFVVALLTSLATVSLHMGNPLTVPALLLTWLVAIMAWLSSRGQYTALTWASNSQTHSAELLYELRQRRGELNRTLHALTEASRRLEQTNRELSVARYEAEEARAAKEQFVANVSHELRTPLNLILGFTEMMYLSPETYSGVVWSPDLESDIGRMYRAGSHLQDLINDILDLSRINTSRLPMFREHMDLRDAIRQAAKTVMPLVERRGLYLRTLWPDELPKLFADVTRLRQVVLNLLSNAIRCTDTGGVTITVDERPGGLVVSVSDTGRGIPPDRLEHIFEEFVQVNARAGTAGGAGLGLAISRQFVQLHGGTMWAESVLGEGTTIHFTLPVSGASGQTSSLQRIPAKQGSGLSMSPVVILDESQDPAEMLGRYLGDHPVLAATTPVEAKTIIASELPMAVIINTPPDAPSDQWVGPINDGQGEYDTPVIRCSIPSPSWLQQSTDLDFCLTKPITRSQLRNVLQEYLDEPGTILVVDDDPGFVGLLTRMLSSMDLADQVLHAFSGTEAVDLAASQRPDLVFLDIVMPEMDGFAVLEALQERGVREDMVVVAVTATSYAEELLRRKGGLFTITKAQGLDLGKVTELLRASLDLIGPGV